MRRKGAVFQLQCCYAGECVSSQFFARVDGKEEENRHAHKPGHRSSGPDQGKVVTMVK